jgi:membrane associated rhomboid family serine protease
VRELRIPFPPLRRGNKVAMAVLAIAWIAVASVGYWADDGLDLFAWLAGSDAILKGEAWRLLTSFIVHQPVGSGSLWHLFTSLLGLYFLGTSLEERWNTKRYLLFLVASGLFASACQVLLGALIPYVHAPMYYGAVGVVDAVAIAWALSFRDGKVQLFFAVPINPKGLILFILGINILFGVVLGARHEGLVTPFAGMLAGWMGADGSPLRRVYLQWRFKSLQSQSEALRGVRAQRVPKLRVVKGGRAGEGEEGKPKKEMLN